MARTYVYLTSGSSWETPEDWNDTDNSIECIGSGGNGGGGDGYGGSGGGGGGYSKKNNIELSGTISYQVGSGLDTWFKSTSDVLAIKGGNGTTDHAYSAVPGGTGGQASSGVGDIRYNGGNGGGIPDSWNGSGGGGGAAGPNGAGNSAQLISIGTAGGSGDAGYGGSGGGGAGTEWSSSPAYGSGGGGNGISGFKVGGAGGFYGGGGGAGASGGGAGRQGLIVISYEPVAGNTGAFFQLFN